MSDRKSEWDPSVLILGPGGVKGYLELGALQFYFQKNLTEKLRTIVGVSIGSIIGLLLAIGYDVDEVITIALSIDMSQTIMQGKSFNPQLLNNWGLIDREPLKCFLSSLVGLKFGSIPTFNELYEQNHIELVIVATNLERKCPTHFSRKTYPNLDVVEAVLMSCNIPFIFPVYHFGEMTYIDGAFSDPFPLHPFDDGETDILGIYVNDHPVPRKSIFSYIYAILDSMIETIKKVQLKTKSSKVLCVDIDSISINPVNLFLDDHDKREMLQVGHDSARVSWENFTGKSKAK